MPGLTLRAAAMHDEEQHPMDKRDWLARRGLLPIGGGSPDPDPASEPETPPAKPGEKPDDKPGNDPDNTPPAEFKPITSQEDFDRALDARLKRQETNLRTRLASELRDEMKREADAAAAKEQGDYKTLYEAELQKTADLDAKIKASEHEALRQRVAAKFHIPADLVDRLKGDTEADLETDAKALAKFVKERSVDTEAGRGRRTPADPNKKPTSGYTYGAGRPTVPWPGATTKTQED